jgi:hypothetical protein
MSRELTQTQNALLGAGSGVIETMINQPLAYCKNASQQRLPMAFDPRVLYRGCLANCLNQGCVTGFQFVANGSIQRLVTSGEDRPLTTAEQILSGGIAGAASAVFCGPLELVMTQQQRKGTSLTGTMSALASRGPTSFLRGFGMTAAREGMYAAGYLGLTPVVRSKLVNDFGVQEDISRAIGAIGSGVLICAVTQPIDTVKTCLQGDVEQVTYKGALETYRALQRENGFAAFYRGIGWRCLRMCAAIFVLDKSRVLLAPLLFPDAFGQPEEEQ